MKLLMVEHPVKGIAYFTSAVKAAIWLETSTPNIYTSMKGGKKVKGAKLEWIDDDTILSQYIDPVSIVKNETIDLLSKAIDMINENDKRIEKLDKKLDALKEIIDNYKNIN